MRQCNLFVVAVLLCLVSCSSAPGENANPVLKVMPTELDFGTTQNGPLIFTVSNVGTGRMDFQIIKSAAWLGLNNDYAKTQIVASTSTQDMVYAVTIDRAKLAPNENQSEVIVIPKIGSSQTVIVRATSSKCVSGNARCTDAFNIAFCGSDGTWQASQACGDGKYCDRPASQCRAQQCKPNAYQCFSGSSSQQCSADGSAWQAPVACPAGQVCMQASGSCTADITPTITGIDGEGSRRAVVDYRKAVPASAANVFAGYRVQKSLVIAGGNLTKVDDAMNRLECTTNTNVFFTSKEGLVFQTGGTDMKRTLSLPAALGKSACILFTLTVANAGGKASAQVYVLQGEPGVTSLVDIQPESAGANCANGGQKILSGLDTNGDGTLAATEVTATKYLCNGASGANGTNGVNGTNGKDGLQGPKGLDGAPAGTVAAFAGPVVPDGWLLCDGKPVNRTAYSALFSAIGTAHGSGDGATTFNLPDFQGRFLRMVDGKAGRDPDAETRKAPSAGGNAGNLVGSVEDSAFASHTHAGTTASAGNHAHSGTTDTQGSHAHGGDYFTYVYAGGSWGLGGGTSVAHAPMPSAGDHSHNLSTSAAGDHSHDITINTCGGSETRPANAYVNYIIKY